MLRAHQKHMFEERSPKEWPMTSKKFLYSETATDWTHPRISHKHGYHPKFRSCSALRDYAKFNLFTLPLRSNQASQPRISALYLHQHKHHRWFILRFCDSHSLNLSQQNPHRLPPCRRSLEPDPRWPLPASLQRQRGTPRSSHVQHWTQFPRSVWVRSHLRCPQDQLRCPDWGCSFAGGAAHQVPQRFHHTWNCHVSRFPRWNCTFELR